MTDREIENLIDRVANRFERDSDIRVLPSARKALVLPARPHVDQVTRELETLHITIPMLEDSVRQVLGNALDDIRGRSLDYIDDRAVERSMARHCPYLFWC